MTKEVKEKFFPKVGDKLYLQQKTGNYYVDLCKHPYTVIGVTSTTVTIQACKLIFNGVRYYDTLPDGIEADENGRIRVLHWSRTKGMWQHTEGSGDRYPEFAHFGDWDYQPYLD